MSCLITNPIDGKESVLGEELLRIFKSESLAVEFYAKIKGPDFKEKFGDWEEAGKVRGEKTSDGLVISVGEENVVKNLGLTTPNGEPKLLKMNDSNQYYFELLDGTSFFLNQKGLRGSFSPKEIKEVSKFFLFNYVQSGGAKSFNEIDSESNQSKIMSIIENSIKGLRLQLENYPNSEEKDDLLFNISGVELYKEEFAEQLKYDLKSLGQKFRETTLNSKGEKIKDVTEEDDSGGVVKKESVTVNTKDTATINTKILLSQIVSREKDKKTKKHYEVVSDFLGTPVFEDFSQVWETLQPLLADSSMQVHKEGVVSVYQKMRGIVRNLENTKPWAYDLGMKLDKLYEDNDGGRYKVFEFVQAFNKTKLNYYVTEFNKENSGYTMYNATATNSRESQIMDRWGIRFADLFLGNGKQIHLTREDSKKISGILDNIEKVYSTFNEMVNDANKIKDVEKKRVGISEAFQYAGQNLFKELREIGVFGLKDVDIDSLIMLGGGNQNEMQTMQDLFVGVRQMINNDITMVKKNGDGISFSDQSGNGKNPFRSQAMIKMLAQAVAMRELDIAESSILVSGGKKYFAYSNPTYISNKIAEWKEDDTSLWDLYSTNVINANSRWMHYLLAAHIKNNEEKRKEVSKERLSKFQYTIASSFTSKGKDDGVDNTKISFGDQLNDNMAKVLRGATSSKGGSLFPTIIAADKSRRIEFSGLEFVNSKIFQNKDGQDVISPLAIRIFTDYFTDEYNRMIQVARQIDNLDESQKIQHYHLGEQNGLKSQLFPEFSVENAEGELATMLYKDGKPISYENREGLSESQREVVERFVEKSLKERLKDTKAEIEKAIDETNVDGSIISHYDKNGGVTAMAGDYLINGMISTIEYTKMFSGDPAYFKNLPDLIKRIPSTYTDGLQLALDKKDDLRFNMAVVQKIEAPSKYQEIIRDSLIDKEIAEAYENVNITDAQAWITPRRWRFLKQKLGQWSKEHDEVFKKMESGARLEGRELSIAAQPLKGVYFEIKNGIPTYLKYSQAVLIPGMVKGTPMKRLLDKMQGPTTLSPKGKTVYTLSSVEEIHEVVTLDGVKVGAVSPTRINKVELRKNKDGVEEEVNVNELADDFELNPTILTNRGYKLQQDLPIKKMHETNIGSQIQKNILEGLKINDTDTYKISGFDDEISGKDVLNEVHNAVSDLIYIGAEEVSKKLGINIDADERKITNTDGLYKLLINEFRQKGGNENIIAALEKRTKFDAMPQIRKRIDSVLMSAFNKSITKISTEGGSYIQVSPFGFEKFNNKSGIVRISDNYNREGLLPPRKGPDGNTLPGQAMIPHTLALELLKNSGQDLKDMTPGLWRKFFKDPKTRELVGYRIPNQGMASNDVLEIVGILPETMGDSIIGYDGIPAKTGSDFDIDKMYIMAPNLMFNKKDRRFEVINDENKEYYRGPKNVKKLVAQNKVVSLYADILKSKHTYDNMMTSIDSGYLKDDINSLHGVPEQKNLDLFSPVTQLKIKKSYMDGKTGVGLTANQLVDHVANQSISGIAIKADLMMGSGAIGGKNDRKQLMDVNVKGQRTISNTLSAFLNAYVDIAKDPYITRGNHNDITANISFMLIRAGATVETVNRFIGQPILKEYVDLKRRSESITKKRMTYKDEAGVEITVSPYELLRRKYNIKKDSKSRFNLRKLSNNILESRIKGTNGMSDNEIDTIVLNAFEFFEKKAAQWTDGVLAAKVETKGAGGSPIELQVKRNKIHKINQVGFIENYYKKFDKTALGTYGKYALNFTNEVLERSALQLSATLGAKLTYDAMSSRLTKDTYLVSDKFGKAVDKGMYTYLMSGTQLMRNNKKDFKELFEDVPEEVISMQEYSSNFFIKELEIQRRGNFNFIGINSKDKPELYQNDIYRGWMDLYEDEDTRDLAVNLVRYSFTQSGFSSNLNQFFTHIPHEILSDNNMNADVKDFFNIVQSMDVDEDFFDQFVRHESNNKDVVPVVYANEIESEDFNHYGFTLGPSFDFRFTSYENNKPYVNYPKFVRLNISEGETGLYQLASSPGNPPVYKRTYKLGYKAGKNRVFEYSYGQEVKESIIEDNNLTKEFYRLSDIHVQKLILESKEDSSIEDSSEENVDDNTIDVEYVDVTEKNDLEEIVNRNEEHKNENRDLSGGVEEFGLDMNEYQELENLLAKRDSSDVNPYITVLDSIPKITPESAKKEIGGAVGVRKDINPSWLSKNGISIEAAAGKIYENNFSESNEFSEDDIRNLIIDFLQMTKSEVRSEYAGDEKRIKELEMKRDGVSENKDTDQGGVERPRLKAKESKENIQERMTKRLPEIANPSAKHHVPKELVKTKIANQYIGDGSAGSSTDRYRKMYEEEGVANTGVYNSSDVIYVSSNGKRGGRVNPVQNGVLQGEYKNVDTAMNAGATIVMDTKSHLEKTKSYNIGELALARYLEENNYSRKGDSGIWKPSKVNSKRESIKKQTYSSL
jgi:hypothetical protein